MIEMEKKENENGRKRAQWLIFAFVVGILSGAVRMAQTGIRGIGDSDYYLADPFYAHAPAKKGDAFLAGVGTAILHAMTAHNKNAVWVMRASSAKPAMLKSLDANRLLVLCDSPQDAPDFGGSRSSCA